jgi:hypothetical protein
MRQIEETAGSLVFRGNLDDTEDCLAASEIAEKCPCYIIDEDDEDYCDGARTCFNCRFRRWVPDGFTCMKGRLGG